MALHRKTGSEDQSFAATLNYQHLRS